VSHLARRGPTPSQLGLRYLFRRPEQALPRSCGASRGSAYAASAMLELAGNTLPGIYQDQHLDARPNHRDPRRNRYGPVQ
jgi:hypothetical protein